MIEQIVPYGGAVATHATWGSLFSNDELNALEIMGQQSAHTPTSVGDARGHAPDENVRRSTVKWIRQTELPWIFEKLGPIASRMNYDFWRLDLTGFGEDFQLAKYDSSELGFYDWHQDYGAVISRKLSFILQLSDPDTYEGGDVEILTGTFATQLPRERGMMIAFPSWQLHRVTPVTSGIRYSLVAWATGPAFR